MSKTKLQNNLFIDSNVKYNRQEKKNIPPVNIFSIVLGIVCLIYFCVVAMLNTDLFMVFWFIAGVFFIALGIIRTKQSETYRQNHKIFRGIFYSIFWIGIACFAVIEGFIVYNGMSRSKAKSDVAIVLGAGLWGDTPTLTLSYRLDTALEYLTDNENIMVVVTGGQGPDETISEAEAMEKYLVEKGISKDRIIKENKARNTEQNFGYTREKLNELGYSKYKSAMIITSSFHMFRSKSLAEKNGFDAYGMPSKDYVYLIPNYYVREAFAVVKSFIFDR